jgi:hypothetical protein
MLSNENGSSKAPRSAMALDPEGNVFQIRQEG